MSWYFANDGKQTGPLSESEFEALARNGTIGAATLVWREGMANWLPYAQLAGAASAVPPPAGSDASSAAATAPGANEVVCAECRQIFPRDNAIQYGAVWVCASCKPIFIQKLKEGAVTSIGPTSMHYAGFWIRFAARFIDGLIEGLVVGLPTFLLVFAGAGGFTPRAQPNMSQILVQVFANVAGLLFSVAYNTFFIGKYAATPGKMAVGIKVVAPDGSPVTYMRAFGRAWADRLSSITCMIGFIIAAFDAEKRSLHDHICNTRVIYK